ncbi:MAG: hypothetical protein K6F80_00005 [Oscillospiraceae bacterium]|nr:hypothetical protein [Oscillospiraceae bacterium]
MAKKKRKKHGKVEARQMRARVVFKPGILVLIVLVTFLACFVFYMISAANTPGYWEKEIVADMHLDDNDSSSGKNNRRSNIINPVPSSSRAADSRMAEVAFIGDVGGLTANYETTSGMVFTDSLPDLAEPRMRSIARGLLSASPKAVYLWYQTPADLEAGSTTIKALVNSIREQKEDMPIYILTAIPADDAENTQQTDTWNASLFAMAEQIGLHYVDVSTTLKANDGTLAPAYRKDETTLYTAIGDQILTHVAVDE